MKWIYFAMIVVVGLCLLSITGCEFVRWVTKGAKDGATGGGAGEEVPDTPEGGFGYMIGYAIAAVVGRWGPEAGGIVLESLKKK